MDSTDEALMVSAAKAARLCGVSLRQWWRMRDAGEIPRPIQFGRRLLWRVAELREWVEANCPTLEQWESRRRSA